MSAPKITFAGHSATFIRFDKLLVAIDPWLEGNPLCPDKLKKPEKIDLIVLSHGHSDHAGEASRWAKHYGATLIATWELAMIMIGEGVPETKVVPMNKGGTYHHQGLSITLTHAFHSSSYDGANGTVYAGEPCGIVLSDDKHTIYHAGDTALFSDMELIRDLYRPQVALLPIGDRFTMGPKEAAMATKLVGAKTVIPIHYKTFDMLTGTAEQFRHECQKYDVQVVVLEAGESYELR